jgi:CorA-like Mg2+ transporter protein
MSTITSSSSTRRSSPLSAADLHFITGFFGMNFGWLTGHMTSFWVFAVYGLGSLVASRAGLHLWFRHSGHLGSTQHA